MPIRSRRSEKKSAAHFLAEENIRLVVHWVGVYKKRPAYRNIDADELLQEGYFGLLRAAQLYNPHRNCQFSTYAAKWIRHHIRRFKHHALKHADTSCDPGLLDTLGVPDAEMPLPAETNTTFDAVATAEMRNAVLASLDDLDARARDIITARFGILRKVESYREIGNRHRISGARVAQIEKKSIRRLQKNENITPFKEWG